jgi:hypothetical protein
MIGQITAANTGLAKVWFSASTFVVKIATFAKPENVIANAKRQTTQNKIVI